MARSRSCAFLASAVVLALASAASAANMSMRFSGGASEITLAPDETALLSASPQLFRSKCDSSVLNELRPKLVF